MMHEWVHCCDEGANHQLPKAAAFWIMWIASVEECSSLTQNLMQIHCSTRSVILNEMTPQYTCSLSGVYLPHLLVLWSRHCSHMHIPVHSPWLPGYINVARTVLVILTMAGLFSRQTSGTMCQQEAPDICHPTRVMSKITYFFRKSFWFFIIYLYHTQFKFPS